MDPSQHRYLSHSHNHPSHQGHNNNYNNHQYHHTGPPQMQYPSYYPPSSDSPASVKRDSSHNSPHYSSHGQHRQQSFSKNPCELFVGNLSFFCEEEHLIALFQQYGQVINARIKRPDQQVDIRSRSLLYGFVTMDTVESCHRASEALNNTLFMGRTIRIEMSSDSGKHSKNRSKPFSRYFQVHVELYSILSKKQGHDIIPNEEFFRNIFMEFGDLLDVSVKEYIRNENEGHEEGLAYITFATENAAHEAHRSLQETERDGVQMRLKLSSKNPSGQNADQKTEIPSSIKEIHIVANHPPISNRTNTVVHAATASPYIEENRSLADTSHSSKHGSISSDQSSSSTLDASRGNRPEANRHFQQAANGMGLIPHPNNAQHQGAQLQQHTGASMPMYAMNYLPQHHAYPPQMIQGHLVQSPTWNPYQMPENFHPMVNAPTDGMSHNPYMFNQTGPNSSPMVPPSSPYYQHMPPIPMISHQGVHSPPQTLPPQGIQQHQMPAQIIHPSMQGANCSSPLSYQYQPHYPMMMNPSNEIANPPTMMMSHSNRSSMEHSQNANSNPLSYNSGHPNM